MVGVRVGYRARVRVIKFLIALLLRFRVIIIDLLLR
jgi:hypothetical protein